MKKYDVIIIGSGPSGLMCAGQLSKKLNVLLLEGNSELGGKLPVSGNGRCNVTNNKSRDAFLLNVVSNPRFLYPTLNEFGPLEIINFFNDHGVDLKEEDNGRMFPVTNKSKDIVDVLKNNLNGVEIKLNHIVKKIKFDDGYIVDDSFKADRLIVATGGITYPKLGTNGFGIEVAKSFGIKTVDTTPVETQIVSNDELISEKKYQGITIEDASVTLFSGNKKVKSIVGNVLITHFGLSGPAILKLSNFVDLKKGNQSIKIYLDDKAPKRLKNIFDNDIIEITVNDLRGKNTAFLTKGGINVKEISPKTFESTSHKNLHFIGEVLDVNAFTGGYNITICLSEGYTLAKYINGGN